MRGKPARTDIAAPKSAPAAGPRIAQVAPAAYGAGEAVACDGSADACEIAPASAFDVARSEAAPAPAAHPGEARALYFHQPHCPNCLKLAPLIAAMTETCSGQGLRVDKIDVSDGPNKAFAARRGVRGTPTLVFEDADGTEVARLVGGIDLAQVHEALAVLTGERCADFTRFQ